MSILYLANLIAIWKMSAHLGRAIDNLKRNLLQLAALTEEQVELAVTSLEERDVEMARKVISDDNVIDQKEVDIEEECLKILALYQPVAFDLRFVVAVLKINNDLERIGDLASNIAERAIALSKHSLPAMETNFSDMSSCIRVMLRNSIQAIVSLDTKLASSVCKADMEVDSLHSANYKRVHESMLTDPEISHILIQLLSVSRYLERIADLATNISEDVIYLVDGKIVRHSSR